MHFTFYMGKRSRHQNYLNGGAQKKAKVGRTTWYRGLALPGYNYLGPGNDLNNGVPTDRNDYVAQDHDYDYRDLEDAGINPYTTYSEADDVARRQFSGGGGGNLGRAFFESKRQAAAAGLIKRTWMKKRHHFLLKQQSDPRHHFMTQVANPENKTTSDAAKIKQDAIDKVLNVHPVVPILCR